MAAYGNICYGRQFQQFVFKGLDLFVQGTRSLQHHDLILIEPYLLVQDKLHLPVNDEGADDEDNRSRKLENDQDASQAGISAAPANVAVQYLDRLEGSKIERRVEPCQDPDDKGGQYHDREQPPGSPRKDKRLGGQPVKIWQQQPGQHDSQDKGTKTEEQGFR